MQNAIVYLMVYRLTGKDKLSLGLLGLWEVIPALLFSLVSGPYVEVREKRKLLTQCVVGYMLLSVFLILLSTHSFQQAAGNHTTVWLVYAGIFFGGILRAFISPVTFSLFGTLLPKEEYSSATTWSSMAWQAGFALGPLFGGMVLAMSNFTIGLSTVLIFQVISLFATRSIPIQPIIKKTKEPILKSIQEGVKFVFNKQMILATLSLDLFAVLFGGATALLPVYADDILKVGEMGYGWLRAAPGIGAITTFVLLFFIPLRKQPGIKLMLCIAGFGITTIIFGVSTSFVLSFIMLFLGGLFDAVSVVIRGTILQLYTPDDMRGRVASVNTMFISSSNEFGAMESGITAKWMGTLPAVVFGGCMTMLVVGVTWFSAPALRTLKLIPTQKNKGS
jgi:MFS family permease